MLRRGRRSRHHGKSRATQNWALALAAVIVAGAVAASLGVRGSNASDPSIESVATSDQPNIILILTDDMRADELAFMPKTRRLLVRKGVRFSNAISPHPMCCPARAALVTGQYGQNNGVQHNSGVWGGAQALRNPDNNVGRWMQQSGYATSYHGKYLNGYERLRPRVEPQGWTIWDAQLGGIYSYWNARFFDGDRYERQYVTRVVTDRTIAAVEDLSEEAEPFFTVINHIAPHVTLSQPHWPRWEQKHARRYADVRSPSFDAASFNEEQVGDLPRDLRFRKVSRTRIENLFRARVRALRSVDDAVAALVERLDDLRELDNTYVVFTSDNGYSLGEHRISGKNFLFDEILDVPLVVRGPGFEPGTVDDTPVTLVDLVATFIDWGGSEPGKELDGVSIEQLRDDTQPQVRDTILVQTGDQVADATPGWHYRGVTTRRYLFAFRAGSPDQGILFDRVRDPDALRNRFDDPAYRAVRRELDRRTQALVDCAGATCNRVFGRLPAPR